MTVWQAIVLGVIQGLTEFLPVSSSAHLALAPALLGWETANFSLAFDVALHTGTLVAVLWYFRSDWHGLFLATLSLLRDRRATTAEQRRALFLLIAFVPAVVAGLLLDDLASNVFRESLPTMAATLVIFGVILWGVDRFAPHARPLDSMRLRDALGIGVAQALALIPGVSRSGATMTAGRLLAFDRVSAARFSFLMSMPIIAAAAVRKVPEALASDGVTLQLVSGTAAAALTGWIAIDFLLRFLTTRGFASFAVYRILLGATVLIFHFNRG